jgi:hypothetical protein
MWFKLIVIVSISSMFIFYGIIWYRNGLASKERYDFKEDFKYSFLTIHRKYESYFNWKDSTPRRIMPVMIIIGGVGMLVYGLIKIL